MSRVTRKTSVLLRALLASSVIIGLARAEVINWTSNASGIWNLGANWDAATGLPPGPNDDAKHLKMFNHVRVAGDRSCLSFEGAGGKGDRLLRIESMNTFDVGTGGLYKSMGAETPIANFPVKMENGEPNFKTTVHVDGPINGIDFGPAAKYVGDSLQLVFGATLANSSIFFGNNGRMFAFAAGSGDVSSTSVTMGEDAGITLDGRDVTGPGDHTVAWTIGDDGFLLVRRVDVEAGSVGGDFGGVDLTVGTAGAQSAVDTTLVEISTVGWTSSPITDNWLLRGYADVAIDTQFRAADAAAGIVLVDNAKMSVGSSALGGAWQVTDSASLTMGGTFFPDTLLVDGTTVNGNRIGDKGGDPWGLTIQNGGQIITQSQNGQVGWLSMSGTFFGFANNSVLTYTGLGNSIHTSRADIGGELVQGAFSVDLEIGVDQFFLVTTELVYSDNGQTVTTPFDSENVRIVVKGSGALKTVESIGPDYKGHNDYGVLFVDSPCVRRWASLLVQSGTSANTTDDVCNTPISGNANGLSCPAGPPTGGVPEAMYVIDLEVQPGATLVAGIGGQLPADVNIYYTGKLTNNGSIINRGGQQYVPTKLKPTLYGDFNGDGNGDEPDEPGTDTRRFNDAFCTCIEIDANYDPLADWNCDGAVDDLDRDHYNANWKNPAGLTTAPCGISVCNS